MAINLNNGLIGLSVLGGTSAYSSYLSNQSSTDSPAVIQAKKAFTTPATTAPWTQGASESGASTSQIAAVKALSTIIDTTTDSTLAKIPDVQTAFTTYKALESLRVLAEAATSKTLSDTARASLQKTFAKGLADLQGYLGTADSDLLQIGFNSVVGSARTLGVESHYATSPVTGQGVTTTRAAAVAGLTGNEVFQVTLTRGSTSEVVNVDLAQSTQPPTLDSVAAALNA